MLPLAHTYISTNASGLNSPLLILGSILPDIATTSVEQIGREEIHDSPRLFADYINNYYPVLSDLGLGVRLHSQVDGGADYYSDDLSVGYAKIEGAKISQEVANLLGIPEGEASLTLAHNFIELAVDLHLYQDQKEIWDIYNRGIQAVKEEFPVISECLGKYLNIDQNLALKELNNLVYYLNPQNLTSKEIAEKNLGLPLIKLRFNKEISMSKTLELVDKALAMTKPSYKSFLDNTVIAVKINILEL